MGAHGIPQFLEFPVDRSFAQGRREGKRVEEDIDVLRKPLDQVPTLREARAAFENDFVASRGGNSPQGFGDEVILFDDGRPQPAISKVRHYPENGLTEILVFKQLHVEGVPWLARRERLADRRANRSRTAKGDSRNPSKTEARTASFPTVRQWRRAWHGLVEARS